MKTSIPKIASALALLAFFSTINDQLSTAFAQGTAFTYQGRLNNGGPPASGTYDFTFTLFTNSAGGTAVAGPVTTNGVVITNGLFTVTMDFGSSVWNGTSNWLEIAVETNGAGGFTTLAPRQELTPTPYSIFAESVNAQGISGTIPAENISGSYTNTVSLTNGGNNFGGNGSGLTGVNASALNGLGASNFWQTAGNVGTTPGSNFVGTTDNRPLELHVNGLRALRLEPGTTTNGAPNVIGGSPLNYVSNGVYGATIAGGGTTNYQGVAYSNSATTIFGTVGGGFGNTVAGPFGATISGGLLNTASGPGAFVGGGALNLATAAGSTIGGGQNNTNSGGFATVAGGNYNVASGAGAFIGGGGYDAHVFSGNVAGGAAAVVAGGIANLATNDYTTVSGGSNNISGGVGSVVGGGFNNSAGSASTGDATVGGGEFNNASGNDAVVGGGSHNTSSANNAAIGGGYFNTSSSFVSFVGGGQLNQATGEYSVVAGGIGNSAGLAAFVGGGGFDGGGFEGNQAGGAASVVCGGQANAATAKESTVGGGIFNTASGVYATVPGGWDNIASGAYSFAAGNLAIATNNNSFVWNGFPNAAYSFQPSRMHVFGTNGISIDYFGQRSDGGGTHWIVLGDGGVQFPGQTISTWTGAYLSDSGTWQSVSDRNRKTGFEHIDPGAILEKIVGLPVESWRYTNELASVRHIGPVAQDFMASFGLGTDDKTISTVDEGGVALAAIQGLNEKMESGTQESEARIQKLEQENADLKARLEKLEQLVIMQNGRAK